MRLDQSKSTFKTRKDEAESAMEPREWSRLEKARKELVLRNSGQGTESRDRIHKRAVREEVRLSFWPSAPSGTSGACCPLALWVQGQSFGRHHWERTERRMLRPESGAGGGEGARGNCSVPDK